MSGKLVPLYAEMAADERTFLGYSILQHRAQLAKLMRHHEIKTVLDYGSGRGDAYTGAHQIHREWCIKRLDVTLYDPAFKRHSHLPGRRFDAVICSDVLEHIPEDEVEWVIIEMFNRAKVFVWASVCCRPASKTFPNGENLHVTLRPLEWWEAQFDRCSAYIGSGVPFHLVESE